MINRGVILIILLLLTSNTFGQKLQPWKKDIRFDRLPSAIQDSLSQRKVSCLLRDQFGTTWFGTQRGLVYYNGQELLTLNDTLKNGVLIDQVSVQTLLETSDGDIWIGTKNDGVIQFQPQSRIYQQYQLSAFKNSQQQAPSILSLFEGQQNLWVGTFGRGVYYYDSLQDNFVAFQDQTNSASVLTTSVVMDLHEDKHGILWGATFGSGLLRIDPHYQTVKQYSAANSDSPIAVNDLFSLEEGDEGTLWIGTYGNGLIQYDRRTEKFSKPLPTLAAEYVQSLHYSQGNLWIATQKSGLYCYDFRHDALHSFSQDRNTPYTIADNNTTYTTVDKYGTLWVVTEKDIYVANATSTAFSFLFENDDSPIHQPITAITTTQAGDIWIGTADASLYQWNDREKKLVLHEIDLSDDPFALFSGNIIAAIEEDDRQGIWVGWSDGTLARWNKESQEWKLYDISLGDNNSLSEAIESIYQDQKGVLWFGVLEHGLFYWNRKTDRIQSAAGRFQSIDPSFTPKVFLEEDQYLWIGTLNKGVIQWHRPTGQTVRYSEQSGQDQSSLPSNQITGLALGSPGYLWVGSFDQGLCRLNTRTGTFSSITQEEGILSNRITSITPGRENKLWIGSIQGITYYDKDNGDISNYPNKEFILDKELVHYCAASTGNAQLFGTLSGIVRVAADIEGTPFTKSPLVISRVTTNKRSFALSPTDNEDNIIELPYNENAVEINYALQQFAFFDDHQYEYRLIGLEEDWKKVGHRTLATYTNLSPGIYRFQLRSRSSQNTLVESENPVTLVINPAWYQTWLFRIFLFIVFSGTIGGIYYYRIISVQKRNRTLATLVAARTQELTDKSKFIEQQNLDIQRQNQKLEEAQSVIQQKNNDLLLLNQGLEERVQQRTQELAATNEALVKSNDELDLFVYRAYHDVIGPIARIEGLCQVAALETKDDEVIENYFKKLLTNCQTARTTLQKVLQIHHVRHHEVQKSLVKLKDFIQEIYAEALKLQSASEASINFTLECDPTIRLETDTHLLKLILQGFIKNAIQYRKQDSDTSWVKVIVERPESWEVAIKIEDNGEGIPSSLHEKLFTMFFRGHETKSGTGLDLYIAKLAAERLHGFLAYSEETSNTQFSVAFSELKILEETEENTYAK